MADAGWYPDPQDSNAEQYWDGQMWTGQRRGATAGDAGTGTGAAEQSAAQETRVNPVFGSGQAGEQGAANHEPTQNYQQDHEQGGYQQPTYQQPAAPQTGYQQPDYQGGYQQGGYQQPGYQQPGYQQGGYQQGSQGGAQPWATPAAAPSKKRRNIIVAAVVVVALVAAGLVALLVLPGGDSPSLTYQGKAIQDPDTVLSSAESSVNKTVSSRHGTKSKDTRCYFVQAEKPVKGTKKSDIDSSLSCGPVLFVDGDTSRQYLAVRLTADTSSSKVTLTPESSLDSVDPSSLRPGYQLVRPDKATKPSGNGGLKVPEPPATTANSITTAALGPTPDPAPIATAAMVGRTRKVTLTTAGFIARYGTGTDARSAPSGQKLLAFRTTYGQGELSSGTGATVKLVAGTTVHDVPVPTGNDYVVAAVPADSAPVLQLIDSGDTQTLSLPQGRPGANNLAVLTRVHRLQVIGRTFNVPVAVRLKNGRKGTTTYKTTATQVALDYWPPVNTAAKPSSPRNALLAVRINYTDPASPGGPYGYDISQIRLRLPTGALVVARNVAPAGKVAEVFEVPAGFTTGTIIISGTQKFPDGSTATIRTPQSVAINIPAG